MNLHLTGKLALVTASSGGIGREIATSLAREGATVIINGRSKESVSAAIKTIQSIVPEAKLLPLATDNGTAEGTKETCKQFPQVDILVNNLGIYESIDFFDITDEQWLEIFEVNVLSGVRLARHYLKGMMPANNDARIIFISSESAIAPSPEMAHYGATKTMQLALSRSLAELTKGTRVTVNAVLPGPTRTPGVDTLVKGLFPGLSPEEAGRKFVKENRPTSLIERLTEPKEIADFVAFVCSPLSSAINGAALRVDGGLIRSIL